jgi:hypothetical protein
VRFVVLFEKAVRKLPQQTMQVTPLQNLQGLDLNELKQQKQLLQHHLREINRALKQKAEPDDETDSLVVKLEKAQDKTRRILARQQVENVDSRLEAMLCPGCSKVGHFQRFCPLKPGRLDISYSGSVSVEENPGPVVPAATVLPAAPSPSSEPLVQVRFTSPDRRIKGENASKLLHEASSLKQWVEQVCSI